MSVLLDNLTPKQQAGLTALLTHSTLEAAARSAGVTAKTLVRWLQDPDFSKAYRRARRDLVETAISTIQASVSKAVDALVRNLTCGRPSVEVAAAGRLLDAAIKGVELVDLAERLDAVEAALKHQQTTKARRFM